MVELQCDLKKTVSTAAALSEHLQEFDALWDWWDTQWLAELSESEREKFEALRTDSNGRQAFRIIRNFGRPVHEPENDFKIIAGAPCFHPADSVQYPPTLLQFANLEADRSLP